MRKMIFFNWGIVGVQCCVSFRCTAMWFSLVYVYVVVVQSLSHVQLLATQWIAACQASLSSTISQSLLNIYIEFVYICVCVCIHIYIFFFRFCFSPRLLKHVEYSSLCYTVELCSSSVFIPLNPKLLIYSPYCLSPLFTHKFVFYVCVSVFFFFSNKFICITFLDSKYKWYHMIFVFLFLSYFI